MGPLLQRREGGGEVIYLQLGYDVEVRVSGRSKTYSKWKPPSDLSFSHVSVSVSLTSQLLNHPLLLPNVSWSASHFCFFFVVGAQLQSKARQTRQSI